MPGWFNLDEGNQHDTSHSLELDTTKYCLHPKRLSGQGNGSHRAAKLIKAALATRVAKATEPPKGLSDLNGYRAFKRIKAA